MGVGPRVAHVGRAVRGGGADARLALRDALAGLSSPDLQQQSAFAVEALLKEADGPLIDFFLREALRLRDCQSGSVRRVRYRLAAQALRCHSSVQWEAGGLVAVRDLLIARIELEDHGAAAAELAALAGHLAAACIDAYCRGQFAALGHSSKDELARSWLSDLLLAPLLRAACRGPARTRVANACLMVHGALLELRRWAKSAGVLHAAVDCLKLMLKLTSTGALALSAGEALLPVQSCVGLLGPRLKAAALEGILQLCSQAMQRGEWQVRKAAADTLAELVEYLLAGEPRPATAAAVAQPEAGGGSGGQQQQQQQGLAALENIVPAVSAAVDQHIRYDRIPQVRQAAAALLQLLQRVPGALQQEQRPPKQQLQAAGQGHAGVVGGEAGTTALGPGVQMAAPLHGGSLGRCRGDLKVIIAERRRQLQESGWEQAAAAVKAWHGGSVEDAAGGAVLRHGSSSVGSAEEEEARIPAWSCSKEQQAAHGLAAQADPDGPAAAESRPPSAAAFHAAAAAMARLQPAEEQPGVAAKRRRGWGSQPASPTKHSSSRLAAAARRSGHDVPVQVFAPPSLPGCGGYAEAAAADCQQPEQLWRQNPLAQSVEVQPGRYHPAEQAVMANVEAATAAEPPVLAPAAAAAVVPCVHHIEHLQFFLRLQAAPAEAELRLAGPGGAEPAPLHSVRFWVQQDGADVGIEFRLPSQPASGAPVVMHRYWLHSGQLCQERLMQAAAGAVPAAGTQPAGVPLPPPSSPPQQQTPVACVPSLPPQQQQERGSTADQPLPGQPAASPAGLPAESPLASLATAALPSFSPDKKKTAAGSPAAAGTDTDTVAAGMVASASTPRASAAAAVGGTPSTAAPGWRDSCSPPAGALSSSPVLQSHPASLHWAAKLRPPGEQLLSGLPDWDRSRPSSPGVGGSGPGSPARASSRPASPSRDGSLPASPSRLSASQQQQQQQQRAGSPVQQHAASTTPQAGSSSSNRQPPGQDQGQQHTPSESRQQLEQQHQQLGASSAGPGPLTAMVTRAVSKLQQLHALEEELNLPVGLSLPGPGIQPQLRLSGAGPAQACEQQQQPRPPPPQQQHNMQPLDPRRSLEPVLSAIREGSSDGEADSCGSGRQAGEMGRLHRLQEQLQLNMREIQRRMDEQQGVPSEDAAQNGAATSGSDDMPAAWDAQEEEGERLAPLSQHRYPPRRHQWRHQEEVHVAEQSPALPAGRPAPEAGSGGERGLQGIQLSAESSAELGSAADAVAGEAGQLQHGSGAGSGSDTGLMLAVNNPLFGSSRPGTAQGMQGMLPPKRSLAAGRRRTSSQGEASNAVGGGSAGSLRQQRQQWRHSPQLSTGPLQSLGSLGSGFSALRNESEAEVHQFLRGSLAVSQQAGTRQQGAAVSRAAQRAASPPSLHSRRSPRLHALEAGATAGAELSPVSSTGSPAVAQQQPAGAGAAEHEAGPYRYGSLDLAAILDSRPASPAKLPLLDSSDSGEGDDEGAGPWQTARSGGGSGWDGWQTAMERQAQSRSGGGGGLWSSSSSSGECEPDAAGEEGSGGQLGGPPAAGTPSAGHSLHRQSHQDHALSWAAEEEEGAAGAASADLQLLRVSSRPASPARPGSSRGGGLSEVVLQTYPPAAVDRLEQLKAQLSPGRGQQQPKAGFAGGVSSSAGAGQGSPPGAWHAASSSGAAGASSALASAAGASWQDSPIALLPLRHASPELPGLGISRRQARLLQVQSAVGRMAGNPGESADASDIQAALQDVLMAQTAHVQAHYQRAAEEQLAALRDRDARDPAELARAVQREAAALEAAQEAATRTELTAFVEEALPRLAEVLSSQQKLLRCFRAAAAAAEQDEVEA